MLPRSFGPRTFRDWDGSAMALNLEGEERLLLLSVTRNRAKQRRLWRRLWMWRPAPPPACVTRGNTSTSNLRGFASRLKDTHMYVYMWQRETQ